MQAAYPKPQTAAPAPKPKPKWPKRAALALVLASCSVLGSSPAAVRADAVLPSAMVIVQRHDAYVAGDLMLTQAQQAAAIQQSYSLIMALRSPIDGEVLVQMFAGNARAVCSRYDMYVRADPKIGELERRVALRTSELFMRVVAQAESGVTPGR